MLQTKTAKTMTFRTSAIVLLLWLCATGTALAQREARVTVKTTDPVETWMQAAKDAGKELKWGSKDADPAAGKITIWRSYYAPGSELQVIITSEVKDGKSVLNMRLPNPANSVGSFIPELKKFVKLLKLTNKEVGEFTDGVE
ncbi:MAG: hypothetical protein KIS94_02335 [Chitinophagales bacterium]|nr:hypothetical protein [Chitinophagales bacterium]